MIATRGKHIGLKVVKFNNLPSLKYFLKYQIIFIIFLLFTNTGISKEQENTINWGKWNSSQGVTNDNERNYELYLYQLDGSFLQDYDEDNIDEALEMEDYRLKGMEIKLLEGL